MVGVFTNVHKVARAVKIKPLVMSAVSHSLCARANSGGIKSIKQSAIQSGKPNDWDQ